MKWTLIFQVYLSILEHIHTLKIDTHTHILSFRTSILARFTCRSFTLLVRSILSLYIAFIQCFVLLDKLLICFECILIKRSNIVYCFQYKNKFVLDERDLNLSRYLHFPFHPNEETSISEKTVYGYYYYSLLTDTNIIKCLFIMFKQNSIQKM